MDELHDALLQDDEHAHALNALGKGENTMLHFPDPALLQSNTTIWQGIIRIAKWDQEIDGDFRYHRLKGE